MPTKTVSNLLIALALAIGAQAAFARAPDHTNMNHHVNTPSVGVHGLLLFGNKQTYVSHLPMYHPPHDQQLIFKVHLKELAASQGGSEGLVEKYKILSKESTSLFTLVPEVFDLNDLVSGKLADFTAELYHGHFERGGKKLGAVKIQLEKKVFSQSLTPHFEHTNITSATTPKSQYVVFGEGGEYFAAHVIEKAPSFDLILKAERPYLLKESFCRTRACAGTRKVFVSDSELPQVISFESNSSNEKPAQGDTLGNILGTIVDVNQQLYLETGDLSN